MSDISINNLNVRYGEKVIFDNFNASFANNKVSVILGGSGVGKTTLLNALASLLHYDGKIDGVGDKISYIFQKDRLIPTISVYKNLDLVLKSAFKDKNERRERIEKFAKTAEIFDLLDRLPTEISGGQAQRVAMARAFAYPSTTILLDEPFKALDIALKSRQIAELIKLNEVEPRTVVFVTHAIDECLLLADDYFVLSGEPANITLKGHIDSDKKNRRISDTEFELVRADLLKALSL